MLINLSGLYVKEVMQVRPLDDTLGSVHMDLASRYRQEGSGQLFMPVRG